MPSKNSNNSWEDGSAPDDQPAQQRYDQDLVAYHEQLVTGQADSDDTAQELPPEWVSRLHRAQSVLRLLEQDRLKSPFSRSKAVSEGSSHPNSLTSARNEEFGRFRILGEIGSGGHGIVFLAWDPHLGREVALKLPRPEVLLNQSFRKRFLHEAHLVAGLNHPGIVPVFEVGEVGPVWYITSRYCRGKNLSAWLREHKDPVPFRAAADLVARLAEAIHHTHARGVLHRDLKPANILLELPEKPPPVTKPSEEAWPDAWGKPLICDFGLARPAEHTLDATATGVLLGTPAYMSPEQAEGRKEAISTATDIWSLGVILYECLAGVAPFGTGTASGLALLQRISHESPPSIRTMRPGVPRDLETICLKCLEKDPQHRYVSAADLADDLHRWQKGEPIRARRHTLRERAILWARREPRSALVASLMVVLTSLLVVGGIWFLVHRAETRALVQEEGKRRQEAEEMAKLQKFFNGVLSINASEARRRPGWTWDNLRKIKNTAKLADSEAAETQLRFEAVATLSAADLRLGKKIVPGFCAYKLTYHPEARWLALAQGVSDDDESKPMEVLLVHPQTGDVMRRLKFPSNGEWIREKNRAESSTAMAVSPGGRYLVVGTRSGLLHLWDLNTTEDTAVSWQGSKTTVIDQLAFAPDEQSFFSLDRSGACLRWRADGRAQNLPLFGLGKVEYIVPNSPRHTLYIQASGRLAHFTRDNPDIPRLADVTLDGKWKQEAAAPQNAWCRAVAPGQTVGVMEREEKLQFFDVTTSHPLRLLDQSKGSKNSTSVAFSPDGRLLAMYSAYEGLTLWETSSGQLVGNLTIPYSDGRFAMTFHPDGKSIAVNANDGTYLCELAGSEVYGILPPLGISDSSMAMSFIDNGSALSVLSGDGGVPGMDRSLRNHDGQYIRWWKLNCDEGTHPITLMKQGLIGFPSKGKHAPGLTPCREGGALITMAERVINWEQPPGLPSLFMKNTTADNQYRFLAIDPKKGAWLAKQYDLSHRPQNHPDSGWTNFWTSNIGLKGAGTDFTCIVAGSRWLVVGRRDGSCLVFDAQTRKHLKTWKTCDSRILRLALDPNEDTVLVGTERGKVGLFSLPEGHLWVSYPGHEGGVRGVAFLQGKFCFSAGMDGELRVCSSDANPFFRWQAPGPIVDMQVSPDETTLAIFVKNENSVRLWRLDRLAESLANLGLAMPLEPIQVRPLRRHPLDGDRLVLRAPRPGSPHGLKVEWYQGMRFYHPVRENHLPRLDDAWVFQPEDHPSFSVRYSGWVEPPGPGKYRLILESDAHLYRMWVDGDWVEMGLWNHPPLGQTRVHESTGKPWFVQVEAASDGHSGRCRLLWQAEGQKEPMVVPESAFYHDYRDTKWHREGKKW